MQTATANRKQALFSPYNGKNRTQYPESEEADPEPFDHTFILGCNYWASHAGTEMWCNWDEAAIEQDLQVLAQNGFRYLRVFPNWRDFQPVEPLYAGEGRLYEYRSMDGGAPDDVDPQMMARFNRFCEIAQEHDMLLIVGLVTGWMSGRLFIPPALNGRNLYTDPVALMFQQKYVRAFVRATAHQRAVAAWDLGNECNCMSEASERAAAYSWSATIANAIRAADPTRPIISGMHSLGIETTWTIRDQADVTDCLTTHPYPHWVRHTSRSRIGSIRTLLAATAETTLYADIGQKPCLVEEIGTMGPMICDEETAASFLRVNLFSNWAHGAAGVMWWCGCEQRLLDTPPYCWNMCERELGMMDLSRHPKPVLLEMKRFREFLNNLDFTLPPPRRDAVCILTRDQDHWGVAYMTAILAKQAGKTVRFAYGEDDLPESQLYLLPSIRGNLVMDKHRYDALKKRVFEGATLYISWDGGFLTEFSELTGLSVRDSEVQPQRTDLTYNGNQVALAGGRRLILKPQGAEVLWQADNMPLFTRYRYGAGTVFFLSMALETGLLDRTDAFSGQEWTLYRDVFSGMPEAPVTLSNPMVGLTWHPASEHAGYAVLINYSAKAQTTGFRISTPYHPDKVFCGDTKELPPYGVCVLRIAR